MNCTDLHRRFQRRQRTLPQVAHPPQSRHWFGLGLLSVLMLGPATVLAQTASVYYICPGNVFTNTISQREADSKGCKARESRGPVSVPTPRPRSEGVAAAPASTEEGRRMQTEAKINGAEQRARDSDARRILEAELRKEESSLEALRKAYNNGEPERQSDERNQQKYLDRVAEMKAAIGRKEADIAAIRRELSKLPS